MVFDLLVGSRPALRGQGITEFLRIIKIIGVSMHSFGKSVTDMIDAFGK
jgi:hypothetical protein